MENKNYSDILLDCAKIAKSRQKQYGSAGESIQLACDIANIAFGIKLTRTQFCQLMVSLKLSRLKFKFKEDSMKDAINYMTMGLNEIGK